MYKRCPRLEALRERRDHERRLRRGEVAMIRRLLETYVPVDHGRHAAIGNLTALADQEEALIVEYQEWPKDVEGHDKFDWTYIGSLYYTFTVVTTIGYGNFAPHTTGGRIATLLAAFVGIPSFAVLLNIISTTYGNLGNGLIHMMRAKSRRLFKSRLAPRSESGAGGVGPVVGSLLVIAVYWLVSAAAFLALNATEPVGGYYWTFGDACFFVPITFLTIGLGDLSISWFGSHALLETFLFVVVSVTGLVLFIDLSNIIVTALKNAYLVAETETKEERKAKHVAERGLRTGNKMAKRAWKRAAGPVITANVYVSGMLPGRDRRPSHEEASKAAKHPAPCTLHPADLESAPQAEAAAPAPAIPAAEQGTGGAFFAGLLQQRWP